MRKNIIKILLLITIISFTDAYAHEGMIALYTDASHSACYVDLPELQIIHLSLFYIRGDGPRMGSAAEFRLRKSSDQISIMEPIFLPSHGDVIRIGRVNSGISIAYHAGETGWCAPDESSYFLCTVPILNSADPDTFTVEVTNRLDCSHYCDVYIGICPTENADIHTVLGGTFVFNGSCYSPDDPFGGPLSVESLTWGAIKSLFIE
jgi:hypothetical protein